MDSWKGILLVSTWAFVFCLFITTPTNIDIQEMLDQTVLELQAPLTPIYDVSATRIGLVGNTTASGHIIKEQDIFVALPSRLALGKTVEVKYGDKSVICTVEDVGPWYIKNPYWLSRPLAEYEGELRNTLNPAGIDLSNGCWDALGIPRKLGVVKVEWRFIEQKGTE